VHPRYPESSYDFFFIALRPNCRCIRHRRKGVAAEKKNAEDALKLPCPNATGHPERCIPEKTAAAACEKDGDWNKYCYGIDCNAIGFLINGAVCGVALVCVLWLRAELRKQGNFCQEDPAEPSEKLLDSDSSDGQGGPESRGV